MVRGGCQLYEGTESEHITPSWAQSADDTPCFSSEETPADHCRYDRSSILVFLGMASIISAIMMMMKWFIVGINRAAGNSSESYHSRTPNRTTSAQVETGRVGQQMIITYPPFKVSFLFGWLFVLKLWTAPRPQGGCWPSFFSSPCWTTLRPFRRESVCLIGTVFVVLTFCLTILPWQGIYTQESWS